MNKQGISEIRYQFCRVYVFISPQKWLFVKFGAKWQFLGYPKKT